MARKSEIVTESEKKLYNYICKRVYAYAKCKLKYEEVKQELECLRLAGKRLTEWLEEEDFDEEIDEIQCAMICEGLVKEVGRYTN